MTLHIFMSGTVVMLLKIFTELSGTYRDNSDNACYHQAVGLLFLANFARNE